MGGYIPYQKEGKKTGDSETSDIAAPNTTSTRTTKTTISKEKKATIPPESRFPKMEESPFRVRCCYRCTYSYDTTTYIHIYVYNYKIERFLIDGKILFFARHFFTLHAKCNNL